jgi:tetratricopeptide (TPR) repeat protein
MESPSRSAIAVAVAASLVAQAARGQDASWLGQRVVTKQPTPLRVGNQVVDDGSNFRVYTVERSEGGWLWLVAAGVAGWVPAGEVVPFDRAIDHFTQLIRADPGSSYAYAQRGIIRSVKGETDIAIADFDQAIRLDPKYARAFNGRGNAWDDKGEYDRAIADLTEAIRLDPKYARAFNNRGLAWSHKGEHDRAIVDFDEAIRLDPSLVWAFTNRSSVWYIKKEYDRAIVDCGQAIRLDPKDPLGFNNRGLAWYSKGEYDRAITDYNQAIRLDPKYALAFTNRGNAWDAKKEYDRAIANYDQAIRLDPKYARALNARAWLHATCSDQRYRDGKRAVESAVRACELTGWKDGHFVGTLAAAHAEAGDFARAEEYQRKANGLYTDPEDRAKGEARLGLYRGKKPYRQE